MIIKTAQAVFIALVVSTAVYQFKKHTKGIADDD